MAVSGIYIIPIILLLVNMAETDNKNGTVYGFDVTISQAPYMATLRVYKEEAVRFGSGSRCTAVIIRNRVLLTRARCIFKQKVNDMVVVIGCTHLRIRTPTTKMLRISAWRSHSKYERISIAHDIAVVFTFEAIEPVKGAVAYAPLNLKEVRKGSKCIESGWSPGNTNLQSLWVVSTSRRECYKMFFVMGLMCTTPTTDNSTLVQNDAGALILCDGKLSGIAVGAWGTIKLTGNTAIHLYIKWIRAVIYLHFKSTKSSPRKARN